MLFNLFKKPKQLRPEDQKELLQILEAIKTTLTPETSLILADFESVEKLIEELDQMSEGIILGKIECLEDLNIHFLPTSGFQELSIENGWSDEYLKLSESFDRIYDQYHK